MEVFKLVREGVLFVLTAEVTLGLGGGCFCFAVTQGINAVYSYYLCNWLKPYRRCITRLMYNYLFIMYHTQKRHEL